MRQDPERDEGDESIDEQTWFDLQQRENKVTKIAVARSQHSTTEALINTLTRRECSE